MHILLDFIIVSYLSGNANYKFYVVYNAIVAQYLYTFSTQDLNTCIVNETFILVLNPTNKSIILYQIIIAKKFAVNLCK